MTKKHRQFTLYLFLILLLTACDLLGNQEPEYIPPLITNPPPQSAYETLTTLTSAEIPFRDLHELAIRLRGVGNIPRMLDPVNYTQGDTAPFWYKNHESDENLQITARLAYQSSELNIWVEEGADVEDAELAESAQLLETDILPTNRAFFGTEWQPGVDGDSRVNILLLEAIGGNVVGYYSSADEFVTAVNEFSNQREILYVGLEHAPVGSDDFYEVVAHEMQHMIHWYTDSNETTWVDEGMAEMSALYNGYDTSFDEVFVTRPDTQLNHFTYGGEEGSAHYGASVLLASYFYDQFGSSATQALVQNPANGIQGFEETLESIGANLTFDEFFAQWIVANYVNNGAVSDGIYGYDSVEVEEVALVDTVRRVPAGELSAVHQYGTDYIRLLSDEPVTLVFTGTQQTTLLSTMPHNGTYYWTTLPADDSDMSLTGSFDLSGLDSATLTFWSWYDIEENWDYAYVMVSQDGGATWTPLANDNTTLDNPQGNSYGHAFTGLSGAEAPVWAQQTMDLSPYTGGEVLIRFEYITDDAVHHQGWAIDEIAIPELDYVDDVEEGDGVWVPAGFVRHTNILPQSYILQVIYLNGDDIQVAQLPLDENQQGQWVLDLGDTYDEAIIVISGSTRITTQPAAYQYQLTKNGG